jgi:ATP-dependent Lon protease
MKQSDEFVNKLKDNFDEMVVFKDLQKNNFISSFKLPSFMRDWVLKRFQDDEGNIDVEESTSFIKEFIPKKEDWKSIKTRVVNQGEVVKFLAKISIDVDIKSQKLAFALPDFGLTYSNTLIPQDVWNLCSESLLKAEENWGIVELGYQPDFSKAKPDGKIVLKGYRDFCPYIVDLEEYRNARSEFDLDEWIDVILGAIDYNASGYEDRSQKLAMIKRLLPFVERRLNMIELAPKGTGKSYLFGSVSRYGWLSSGGMMSRAKMFYDLARHTEGLVFGHDYVALDEVQTITFADVDEMRGALKGYMENGRYTVGNHQGAADAGIILLGNIPSESMNEYINMFRTLPEDFRESALIDRFHGFLKGWELPRMNDDLKICGWALNSEYFTTIMHELRNDATYRAVVDKKIDVPDKADTRDTEAIKRICTAFLKLLFPHVQKPEDISSTEFKRYCLTPATEMRAIIKLQLGILDPEEFGDKPVPSLTVLEP